MTTFDESGSWRESDRPVPRHVAIIMDGNGRWAAMRGLPRFQGHRQGMESVRLAVRHACDVGISYLTLYSFSSENWNRPQQEVSDLMGLLKLFIRRELAELNREGVRIRVIGSRSGIAADILALLDDAVAQTSANPGLVLTIAFNYGSRDELTRAVARIAEKVKQGVVRPEEIQAGMISDHLDTAGIPDPDLLIRTSGELRLSNFLLWQCAYSELVFLDAYWPEFSAELFDKALTEYYSRERRFGGLQARSTG